MEEKELIEELVNAVLAHSKTVRLKAQAIVTYNVEVGSLELVKLEKGIELIKVKRKLDLMNEYKANNNEIDYFAIEEIIKDEMVKYQNEYIAMKDFLYLSNEIANGEEITDEEDEALDNLYVRIVREFHPLLDGLNNDESKKRFEKVRENFVNYDLEGLKVYEDVLFDEKHQIDPYLIKLEIEKLNLEVKRLLEEFPLNKVDEDNNLDFSAQIANAKQEIDQIDIQIKEFEEKIEEFYPVIGLEC